MPTTGIYTYWHEVMGHLDPHETGTRVIMSSLSPQGAMLLQRYSAALCSAG